VSSAGLSVVQRTVAVAATFAILLISFVSSFSVYLGQQRAIAEVRAEIAGQKTEIGRLQDELERWKDPAYVRAQARDRLGWVMPGEVGYRVIDENGQLVGGTISGIDEAGLNLTLAWYETAWESLVAADQPAPLVDLDNPVIFDPEDGPR
jgi:cell division protein FtsB